MSWFGADSLDVIDKNIKKSVPDNTVKSKTSVWNQFSLRGKFGKQSLALRARDF